MKGIVTRVQANLYKVKLEDKRTVECSAKGLLKYKKMSILVGDMVEVNNNNVIDKVLPRKNSFIRPPIANVDQLIVVVAATNPKFEFLKIAFST